MAAEKPLELNGSLSGSSVKEEGSRTVAVLYPAVPVSTQDREEQLEKILSPALTKALLTHASNEVYGLLSNVNIAIEQFNIRDYFGEKHMPQYHVRYKTFIKDAGSVSTVRKAQKAFLGSVGGKVDESNTFVAFGVEGMFIDVGDGMKVSNRRRVKTG